MELTIQGLMEIAATTGSFGLGTGAGFFALRYLLEWIGVRVDRREAAALAVRKEIDEATKNLINGLEARVKTLMERVDHVEDELQESNTKHSVCERELARLQGLVQGWGDAKNAAQTILAAERVIDRERNGPQG